MKAGKKTHAIYISVVVVLALAAGALFLAHRALIEESAQLASAHSEALAERNKLQFESVMRIDRVRALEAEVKALKDTSAGLAVESGERAASAEPVKEVLARAKRLLVAEQERAHSLAAEKEALARKLAETGAELAQERSRLAAAQEKLALGADGAALQKSGGEPQQAQPGLARLSGARGVYTVQDGDSLSRIAVFFYHEGHRWTDIHKKNALLIEDPDRIFPGQVLVVP